MVNTPRSLSDQELHKQLVQLKSKESQIVALIIAHLQEVYRRRLFADFGCSSLHDYCIRILGYSNGEAHRKISACILASQVPEVRQSIARGEMSLSNAASVQTLVSKIKKSASEDANANDRSSQSKTTSDSEFIRAIVERVKHKSTRECEIELHKIAKEMNLETEMPSPSRRNINEVAQVRVCLNRDKLDRLKLELGIASEEELLNQLIAEKLNQLIEEKQTKLKTEIKPKAHKPDAQPRSISTSKRITVLKKANGKCENCGSESHLQIDHKRSVALGGGNDLENLRVLCRSCNQRAAIHQLGFKKMEPFLNKIP